jgi:hypothetical protein
MDKTYLPYLNKATLYLTVRNPWNYPIEITKATCLFDVEAGHSLVEQSRSGSFRIAPRGKSEHIEVVVTADPAFKQYTNNLRVRLDWLGPGPKSAVINPLPPSYLTFHVLQPPNRTVFVSHKDPQDEVGALHLQRLFEKVGYKAYLAKVDRRPGTDIWAEKIPNAMRDCHAVVVLWTRNTAQDPRGVRREIALAKELGKPIILAKESGVEIPPEFPSTVEYIELPSPASLDSLRDLVVTTFAVMERE